MFDYDIRLKKQMYLYLDALCKMTVIRLMNGEEDNVVFPFSSTLLSFIARIEWLAPKLNSPFVKVNEKSVLIAICVLIIVLQKRCIEMIKIRLKYMLLNALCV